MHAWRSNACAMHAPYIVKCIARRRSTLQSFDWLLLLVSLIATKGSALDLLSLCAAFTLLHYFTLVCKTGINIINNTVMSDRPTLRTESFRQVVVDVVRRSLLHARRNTYGNSSSILASSVDTPLDSHLFRTLDEPVGYNNTEIQAKAKKTAYKFCNLLQIINSNIIVHCRYVPICRSRRTVRTAVAHAQFYDIRCTRHSY